MRVRRLQSIHGYIKPMLTPTKACRQKVHTVCYISQLALVGAAPSMPAARCQYVDALHTLCNPLMR